MPLMRFFADLAATNETREAEEQEKEQERKMAEAMGNNALALSGSSKTTDWGTGPEALIKQALLVGNLTTAVECCFKSGLMAEALLLASGGGTELWTRARDEYLRLQGDSFLNTVGSIMTNEFEKLIASSSLLQWKETLAIIATYSGDKYQALCEQLGERLEKEKFDILSAVICYISAGNFAKTVGIWANTCTTQGSQKLALQDLVEKMAVFQEATKFNQADPLFNAKLTQYAEILANSGRLTAAMRYLYLLRDDASSSILRDRIYNSAPVQMSQMFGRAPPSPFQVLDIRQHVQQPVPQQHVQQQQYPGNTGMHQSGMHGVQPGTRPGGMIGPIGGAPSPTPMGGAPGGPGPMPRPGQGFGGNFPQQQPQPVGGGFPQQPSPGGFPQQPQAPMGVSPPQQQAPIGGGYAPAPVSAPPAGSAGGFSGQARGGTGGHAGTAPTASAMPVTSDMPTPWPLPSSTQQMLYNTNATREANMAVQASSYGGANSIIGEPMAPNELQQVKQFFGQLLDTNPMFQDPRKKR